MQTQEVAIKPQLKVILKSDAEVLDEVVVTALGISREKKALGYAVQEVGATELTKGGQLNVGSALSGKMAGVQITQSGGAVGSSQRIVVRGNSSFGENQPLIVVDGVPIINDQATSNARGNDVGTNNNGGVLDLGSGMNDINPDDIESISVLKGGSAAALYGMRAGNGVILITTKSGKKMTRGYLSLTIWTLPSTGFTTCRDSKTNTGRELMVANIYTTETVKAHTVHTPIMY
jgi:TonB-dependent SusC/RagA subfamily outer membrane receptor